MQFAHHATQLLLRALSAWTPLLLLALGVMGAGCEQEREHEPAISTELSRALPRLSLAQLIPAQPGEERELEAEPARPRVSLDLPDRCSRLLWRDTDKGPVLSKERPKWLRTAEGRSEHQAQIRELVFMVADELGADERAAEMVWRKAIYESSGNAANVHIRTKDLEANRAAAGKGRRRATERWRWAKVPVFRKHRGRYRQAGKFDAWALGRGLFGMVTGLHMHRWSADAPPWSLCDPLVATVTVFWAMRAGLAECKGESLRDAYRRFSSGKCAERTPELERRFDRLARGKVRGLSLEPFDPDAPAVFGRRWAQDNSDRGELLAVLQARAQALGLGELIALSPALAAN